MNRKYELMLVLHPTVEAGDEKTQDELVKKLLGGQELSLKKTVLGKKELSYPILKQTEGLYVFVELEGAVINIGKIQAAARVQEKLLRHLLKRVD